MEQICNGTIYQVCFSVLQAGEIGEYFIRFIYYPEIESTIYYTVTSSFYIFHILLVEISIWQHCDSVWQFMSTFSLLNTNTNQFVNG